MKGWQDFEPDMEWTCRPITITETHVVNFAGLTGDYYFLHTNDVEASKSQFRGRIAHGPLVYAMAVGQAFQRGFFDDAILAFLGVQDLTHPAPCRIGSTVTTKVRVLEATPTRDMKRGVATMQYTVTDEKNAEVMSARLKFLMRSAEDTVEVATQKVGPATKGKP